MTLKAWHVYEKDGYALDDILFAQTRGQAIAKSELLAESGIGMRRQNGCEE